MIDLNKLLNSLKIGMEISEEFSFLKKYDKNKNSIFEQDEIETITDELKKSATNYASDDNSMSTEAVLDFYNKSFNDGQKTQNWYSILNYVEAWYYKVTGQIPDIQTKLDKNLAYQNLSDTKKEYVQLVIRNHMSGYVEDLVDSDNIDVILNQYVDKAAQTGLNDDELATVLPTLKQLTKIPNFSIELLNPKQVKEYSKNITPERIEYIIDNALYNNIDSNSAGIYSLFSLSDVEFEQSKKYLELEGLDTKPNADKIKILIQNSQSYERIKELIKDFGFSYIPQTSPDVEGLICCSEEDYQRAKELSKLKYKQNNEEQTIDIQSAYDYLIKLSDEEITRTLNLMNIPAREYSLDIEEAATLSRFKSESLNDFIKENPNFYMNSRSSLDIIFLRKTLTDDTEYMFDKKHGLIEVRTKIYNPETDECTIITDNSLSRIKQEVTFENYKSVQSVGVSCPKKEITKFYDKNNKLIKTVTVTPAVLSGLPTQVTTYPNGKTITNQYATYDSDKNTRYTERHFVSPSGVKTDYTFVQTNNGSRIIDYVITDKKGKVLMQKHNTFQQLSDNHYITSTNGHGYDITIEGKTIKIVDSKDRTKINTIDLSNVIENKDRDKIIEMLKIIPGNQLLMLKNLPLRKIIYDDTEYGVSHNNGFYENNTNFITIGKQTNISTSELERLRDILIHEFGHYIDFNGGLNSKELVIADNDKVKSIFQRELTNFISNSTSLHQDYLSHILFDSPSEKTGDTNRHLYTAESNDSMRSIYFMQYFPETIAAIAEAISQKEQECIA